MLYICLQNCVMCCAHAQCGRQMAHDQMKEHLYIFVSAAVFLWSFFFAAEDQKYRIRGLISV